MILKTASKLTGYFFASLAITLFLFSFFLSSITTDIDNLKISLQASLTPQLIIEVYSSSLNEQQIKEFCKSNPAKEECQLIENPGKLLDQPEIDQAINKIKSYSFYLATIRILSVLLFILALAFIFFSGLSLLVTLYKTSFYSAIASASAILYYKLIPKLFDDIISKNVIAPEIQSKLFSMLVDTTSLWLHKLVAEIVKIAIILTVIFLVLTIIFYFIKKSKSKVPDQQS